MKTIVAGLPRCGTTYMYRSLAGLEQGDNTPDKERSFIRSLDKAMKKDCKLQGYNQIIKTHSHAPSSLPEDCKVIFMFGDVEKAVISFRQNRWDPYSIRNQSCRKPMKLMNIYKRDELKLEKHLDSWTKSNGYPVLLLRYEKVFDNVDIISSFIGREVHLLPWVERGTKLDLMANEKDLLNIRKTYGRLIKRVNEMPDYLIIDSGKKKCNGA